MRTRLRHLQRGAARRAGLPGCRSGPPGRGGSRGSLEHRVLPGLADLHDNNVFASLVVFDWGDACLGHPFASLLVTLRSVAAQRELSAGAPELRRLRDAYLEAWTDRHSRVGLEPDVF